MCIFHVERRREEIYEQSDNRISNKCMYKIDSTFQRAEILWPVTDRCIRDARYAADPEGEICVG